MCNFVMSKACAPSPVLIKHVTSLNLSRRCVNASRSHLAALSDALFEQNLLRTVEPYSVVEIEYVAQQVRQGRQDVEAKYVSSSCTYFA